MEYFSKYNKRRSMAATEFIDSKFKSGNSIPVGSATILREEWEAVRAQLSVYYNNVILAENDPKRRRYGWDKWAERNFKGRPVVELECFKLGGAK